MRKFLTFFVSFLSLCAISCTKNELSVIDTVPKFEIVEATLDDHNLEFSAELSIKASYNWNYVYGFEISADTDMAGAVVVSGHGLGHYISTFTGAYDIYDWNGGTILYYRAFISRKEGEQPVYSEIFKVQVPKFEYESLMFMSAGESTIKLVNEGGNTPQLFYSYDELKWTRWDYSALEFTKNKPIFINGDNLKGFSKSDSQYSHFSFSGSPVDCYGSIMTLIDRKSQKDEIPSRYCFKDLFVDCSLLDIAPTLSAVKLHHSCYEQMFKGCTSLKSAPELPATSLFIAVDCYSGMFEGCTGLQSAPELPATRLNQGCYRDMFKGCTSLKSAPRLPATDLTLASGCYSGMFEGCTSLISAPELPATDLRLASHCYMSMFSGCTSLQSAPKLPATTLADYCYTFMFTGCTSLQTAPELPATKLTQWCYLMMFKGCTSLNRVVCKAQDISAQYCTEEWLSGVASSGTFVKSKGMTSWTRGEDGIPYGWTISEK